MWGWWISERKAAFLDFSAMTKVYGSYLLRCVRFGMISMLERHARVDVFRKRSNINTWPPQD